MVFKIFCVPIILLSGCLFSAEMLFADDSIQKTSQKNLQKTLPFFALCMDTHDEKHRTIEQQNEMLSQLGFDGVAHLWLKGLPERVASAKKYSLNVTQVYFQVNLDANPPFDQDLSKVLPCLKGQGTQLALLINGGKPSDISRDEKAVEIINQINETAKQSEVQVVLYPHVGAWLEKVADTVRIAEKFNKQYPNRKIGVMFNLCHWTAIDKSENLEQVLTLAEPYLKSVTINGSDTPEEIQSKKGNRLQPLDSGSFNIATFLSLLKKIDYQGPVGLQCYGIRGDAQEHLTRSIKTWRSLNGL
ncbi:MAG: sugar phosphate isomerase/epimerase [Planctomycetaceae bacterium]|jgi:sugar phosphate isomerase/epimerase|nr:sugar phosphate isomerase/epimerase [Planctomycetaceae bacterium]